MSDAPKHEIPMDLYSSLKNSGAEIQGHREIDHATQYQISLGSDTANLNVYGTGKVLPGGKNSGLKRQLESWRLEKRGSKGSAKSTKNKSRYEGKFKSSKPPMENTTPRVGTDEAGKGEYLGPLVVAGVRILGETHDRLLREAGVRDSKDLSVTQVRNIASKVCEIVGERNICVLSLAPQEYGRRRNAAGSNVNRLLGELNVEIINKLQDEVKVAVIDSFGSKARSYIEPHVSGGIALEIRHKAEDDTAVAAASILARARYLEEMERLSKEVGFELPRGSTHVEGAARRVVAEAGEEGLKKVAKFHFSTTKKVLEGAKGAGR